MGLADTRLVANWGEPEYEAAPDDKTAEYLGFELTVWRAHPNWRWMVKVTSARCEWPELVDSGSARTEHNAKVKAEAVAIKSDKTYPHINYG